jgi:hypothetical protein
MKLITVNGYRNYQCSYVQTLQKRWCTLHHKSPMKRHTILQHNNGHPNIAHLTWRKIKKFWVVLLHPPYSPDLAPSSYHLFRPTEDYIKGQHYENEAIQQTVYTWCEILQWTSTTLTYTSLCSSGRYAWIILGISYNNDKTSPVTISVL